MAKKYCLIYGKGQAGEKTVGSVEIGQNKQHTVNMLNFIAQDSRLSKRLLLLVHAATKNQDNIHAEDEISLASEVE